MSSFEFKSDELLFNRYRLKDDLGGDAFSAFWLARDEKARREVLIHFLPDFIKEDERAVIDLRRAGWRVCELRHPNIGRCYELLEDGEYTALVFEHLDGNSLAEIRAAQPNQCFQVSEIRELLRQTLVALQHAHSKNQLPHGGLTPSDIQVTEKGQVKVLGFQTPAVLFDALVRKGFDEWDATAVPYYSPQRWNGEEPIFLDDVYSLGVIIYELLTGDLPFLDQDVLHHTDEIPTMKQRLQQRGIESESIPDEWEIAVAACVKHDPEKRPQSVAELAWRLGIDIESAGAAAVQPVQMPAASKKIREEEFAAAETAEAAPDTFWAIPRSVIISLFLIVVIAVGVVWFIERRNQMIAEQQERAEAAEASGLNEIPTATTNAPDTGETPAPLPPRLDALDPDFEPPALDANIQAVLIQPDGKVLIAGFLNRIRTSSGIVRLLRNGSMDDEFLLNENIHQFDGAIHDLTLQRDGRLLVAGEFKQAVGADRSSLARFGADGALDRSFQVAIDGPVYSVALQLNGQILIGGEFTSVNGQPRTNLARLNPGGTLDDGFAGGEGTDGSVQVVTILADGRILIGGRFNHFAQVERHSLARLAPDGRLDLTFAVGEGADGSIRKVVEQRDGQLFVGGGFRYFNGQSKNGIVRLFPNGRIDDSFNAGEGANGTVTDLALIEDSRLLVGGEFTEFDGAEANRLALLDGNGSIIGSFNIGSGFDGGVHALAMRDDEKLIVGGSFHAINEILEHSIVQLDLPKAGLGAPRIDRAALYGVSPNETWVELDDTFDPGEGADGPVHALALQVDGRIIVAGAFSQFDNVLRNNIARLNPDGSLDESFTSPSNLSGVIHAATLQPDGKILIGGRFRSGEGSAVENIARLNPDGTYDADFSPPAGPDGPVFDLALQLDGKVILAGDFGRIGEVSRKGIARLLPTGALDEDFDPILGVGEPIHDVYLLPDDTLLIGGEFQRYNGFRRQFLARLNPDGSILSAFRPDARLNFPVRAIAVQSDGKIIAGGGDEEGNPAKNMIRLNPIGSLDGEFNPGGGANRAILAVALTHDQHILAGGLFENFDRHVRQSLVRLNPDGTVNESFDPQYWVKGGVRALLIQPDGKILLGGDFSTDTEARYNHVLRLRVRSRQ